MRLENKHNGRKQTSFISSETRKKLKQTNSLTKKKKKWTKKTKSNSTPQHESIKLQLFKGIVVGQRSLQHGKKMHVVLAIALFKDCILLSQNQKVPLVPFAFSLLALTANQWTIPRCFLLLRHNWTSIANEINLQVRNVLDFWPFWSFSFPISTLLR